MQKTQPRKKGFSFLSFFLGFLFGIIFLVGSIAGVAYFALSADIDNVLGIIGVDNSKDENGEQPIINTDPENGGVGNLLELFTKFGTMFSDFDNLSVGEVETLVPAVRGMVDGVYGAVAKYIELDRSEMVGVKFADFGTFVQEKVMLIQPASLMDSFGMGESLENPVFKAVFFGAEAKYVINGEEKYPVYYDTYVLSDGAYLRSGDNSALPAEYVENLVQSGENYRLNYYFIGETCYVTDGEYTFVQPQARVANGAVYSLYSEEFSSLSGNYYVENGEKIIVTPITLGSFNNVSETLAGVYLDTLLTEGEENELARKVLAGISLGDIMSGKLDFEATLSNLPLSDLIAVAANDGVMMNLVYKINGVSAAVGQTYSHTGTYKYTDGETTVEKPCFIETDEEGKVIRTYYADGETQVDFPSISVADLMNGLDTDEIMKDMTVDNLMDIHPDEAIMAYLAYGIYDLQPAEGGEYAYTAKYDFSRDTANSDEVECFVTVNEVGGKEIISSVYYLKDGEKTVIGGTAVNEINDKINTLTYKLKIKELVKTDNKILNALGDYTVISLGDGINTLTLGEILDIDETSGALLQSLKDTPVNALAGKIDTLTLGEMVDGIENNFLLKNLADTTINELPDALLALTLNDLYADSIYGDGTEGSATLITVTAENFNSDYIYYVDADGKPKLVNKGGENAGKLTAFPGDGRTYYTYGEAQGMWKMLLYTNEKQADGTLTPLGEKAYTLNSLTDMMGNVSLNMSNATLYDLHENELLVFTNPDDLNRIVEKNGDDVVRLGDLKLTEAISKFAALLEKAENLPDLG